MSNAAIVRSQCIAPSNYRCFVGHPGHSREIPLAVPICARRAYIPNMVKLHPHAEAIYSVVPLDDGSFGVEVIVPEANPARVSGFGTEIAAGAWIETHKRQVELNLPYRRPKPRGG